jgi:hypothetical protein
MRTTLTIEDDIMAEIKEKAHREGVPVKRLINQLLRLGLGILERPTPRKRYRCPTHSLGAPTSHALDLDKALAIAGALEDEETVRKLELRK